MKNTKKISLKGIKNPVKRWVARWANCMGQDYDNGAKGALDDLCYGGVSSGIIVELIYTRDVHAFFKKYSLDILAWVEEYEKDLSEKIARPEHLDYAHFYVYAAVEGCAQDLLCEMEADND